MGWVHSGADQTSNVSGEISVKSHYELTTVQCKRDGSMLHNVAVTKQRTAKGFISRMLFSELHKIMVN